VVERADKTVGMTANKTIAVNAMASYARTFYAVVLGLFSGRWTLMALGQTDYGLMGVIGGLTVFISFVNSLMASSVGRFYAFAVGRAAISKGDEGLEESRKWFNTALLLHTAFPIVAMCVGYPVGVWLVEHYLTIPPDRIGACVWVWRFVCVSCFVGMVNVPFQAMYTAKQEIAELTVYSFVTSTLNVLFLYYMINHPGVWLAKFMAWTCCLSIFPQIVICVRAVIKYPECRLVLRYLWNCGRIRQIATFAGGRLVCGFSQVFVNQGTAILVNKMLGPVRNATMGIGNSVSGYCLRFSGSFTTAFSPAITNAVGAGDLKRMKDLVYATCSVAGLAMIMFALPLCLEIDGVLALWLKSPPPDSAVICVIMLLSAVCNCISDGLWMGIFAVGKVFAFQTWESIAWFLVVPVGYVLVKAGMGISGVALSILLARFAAIFVKLHFARKHCGISAMSWGRKVFLPLLVVTLAAGGAGFAVRMSMAQSILRILTTCFCSEVILFGIAWKLVLPESARGKVLAYIGIKSNS